MMGGNSNSTSLFQIVISRLFERSSPDMLLLVNFASDVMDDRREPALVKFGAFLVGTFARWPRPFRCDKPSKG
jgi:hypothetical protein